MVFMKIYMGDTTFPYPRRKQKILGFDRELLPLLRRGQRSPSLAPGGIGFYEDGRRTGSDTDREGSGQMMLIV